MWKCGNSQYQCCQLSMSPLELGVGFWHWQHFHIGTFLSLLRRGSGVREQGMGNGEREWLAFFGEVDPAVPVGREDRMLPAVDVVGDAPAQDGMVRLREERPLGQALQSEVAPGP